MNTTFKSDHLEWLLQSLREDEHTIQLMCQDGIIRAPGLLLATISPLIKVRISILAIIAYITSFKL